MKEEDIINLSESQIQKIERVNKSIEDRLEAEAKLESQKKYRILFERTAKEALPFVVYVIYMGSVALLVLFKILEYTDARLWIGAFLLFVIMVAPLFVLPTESWKNFLRYLKNKLTGSSS